MTNRQSFGLLVLILFVFVLLLIGFTDLFTLPTKHQQPTPTPVVSPTVSPTLLPRRTGTPVELHPRKKGSE